MPELLRCSIETLVDPDKLVRFINIYGFEEMQIDAASKIDLKRSEIDECRQRVDLEKIPKIKRSFLKRLLLKKG